MKITLSNPKEIRKVNTHCGNYAIDFDGQYLLENGKNWQANKTIFFWTKKKATEMLADLPFRNVVIER